MNRRALLVGAVAALVVVLGWWFLLWSPRNDDISEARDRKEQAEEQAQQLETEIARLEADDDDPLRLAKLQTMRLAVPDDPNLAEFILQTNDVAVKAGIDFISIAPTPPAAATSPPAAAADTTATTTVAAPASLPAEVKVALQLQGGYFQVLEFVNRLNDLPRLVVVDSVNVTADQTGRLSAGLQLRMFVRALPAGFGGTPTTTTPDTTTTTTAPVGATTTTVAGGATTTTVAGATTTTTAGAQP